MKFWQEKVLANTDNYIFMAQVLKVCMTPGPTDNTY